MFRLLLRDGRGVGGGGNDGGVVSFLLCLDQGLSPLLVTFLMRLPDAVRFLFLLVSGGVVGGAALVKVLVVECVLVPQTYGIQHKQV